MSEEKLSFSEWLEKYYTREYIEKMTLRPFQIELLERAARGEIIIWNGGLRAGRNTAIKLFMNYKNKNNPTVQTTVFRKSEKMPKDISPEEAAKIQAEILNNINGGIRRSLLFGYKPEPAQTETTGNENSWTGGEPITFEKILEVKREVEEMRKGSEVELNGEKINLLDYEEVSKQNQQFLPAGFRAILNVARTVAEKTKNPLPTDLIIFDLNNNRALFIGGNRKEWQPFWAQFIDKENYK